MVNIYSLIPEARLDEVLGNFSSYITLPIFLMDSDGNIFKKYGAEQRYCTMLNREVYRDFECKSCYKKAAERAGELGEGYIFSCDANMNLIAFSLMNSGETVCTVFIGPFLMDTPDSTLISEVADKKNISADFALKLYDELENIQVIQPRKVSMLKKLADDLLTPLLPSERSLMLQKQEKVYQQAKISETLRLFREQPLTHDYDYYLKKESQLLAAVKKGDIKSAKATLNEILGYVLFSDYKDLSAVRMHTIELTVLLSRVAIEGGAKSETVRELNRQFLVLIEHEQDMDDLCLLLQEEVESFAQSMFENNDMGNRHIKNAVKFISEHYSEKITLEKVAEACAVSPNYLSSLFHDVMGMTMIEYINHVRVDESRRLLLTTDYSMSEIAVALGFGDQSHFCRVFRRYMGISPGKYRQ